MSLLVQSAVRHPPSLTVVVPCFNEQEVLAATAQRLAAVIEGLVASGDVSERSVILFVDDGSSDQTWALIEAFSQRLPNVHGLRLARNFGHQYALLAGLMHAETDVVVSIDADLQDPPETIQSMIAAYRSGADVVCGVRNDRTSDAFLKRATAALFYGLMRRMGVHLIAEHADFRLMSRPAIEALRQFGETNLFLRGLVPQLGFRVETVEYRREARLAGSSKYSLPRMLALSANGITSFSLVPLRMITFTGLVISSLAFAAGVWASAAWLFGSASVSGWTSIVIPLYFLGGIQLLSLGIIGEYLGKSYLEAKRRPRYIVEKSV
jgi:glycosyltransferase involved in cell wall biosynthesis